MSEQLRLGLTLTACGVVLVAAFGIGLAVGGIGGFVLSAVAIVSGTAVIGVAVHTHLGHGPSRTPRGHQ